MVPSRLPTSFGEPGTGSGELSLGLLKIGGSLVTAVGDAGNLELRLDPHCSDQGATQGAGPLL